MQPSRTTQIVREWLPGLLAGAASYLYVWLTPRNNDPVPWLIFCFLGGFLAALLTSAKIRIVLGSVLAGSLGLHLTHLALDLADDPTSHNLFPFELVFTLAGTAACALLGILLARTARRLVRHLTTDN